MIQAHGGQPLKSLYVENIERRRELERHAESLPSVLIESSAAANAVMLAAGYFSPLGGYMNKADAVSIAASMRTESGLFFPVPVLNRVESSVVEQEGIEVGAEIALLDPNCAGNPVIAIQRIETIEYLSEEERVDLCQAIYGATDTQHPGVATFLGEGNCLLSGSIEVLNYSYFPTEFKDTFRTAVEIREEIAERGWSKVVAFQTRNPMHRAHEELCKIAMDQLGADGCVIHMLLGRVKPGDLPAMVRDDAIRKMVELYFPPNSVMVSGYGFDMLYAGPREAVLHALFRQNMGATHLIVGRDHAGVGDYYGAFDAQDIFEQEVPNGALEIEIFKADHTAFSRKLERVVMMRDAPDHRPEDFVLLSGTRVRSMLQAGEALPAEFARPEVAEILMHHYQVD